MRYLLITFLKRPNGQIDEQVGLSKKVKPEEQRMCNIIIDFQLKKVVKCVIDGKVVDTDYTRMVEYYKEFYPQIIEQLERIYPHEQ